MFGAGGSFVDVGCFGTSAGVGATIQRWGEFGGAVALADTEVATVTADSEEFETDLDGGGRADGDALAGAWAVAV